MSLPEFTATTKLAETGTGLGSIVRAFNALVTNLQQIFTSIRSRVQLDSVLLQGVSLVAGVNQVPHTLGRAWTGCTVVSASGAAEIYQPTNQFDRGTYITLVCSTAISATLEVF